MKDFIKKRFIRTFISVFLLCFVVSYLKDSGSLPSFNDSTAGGAKYITIDSDNGELQEYYDAYNQYSQQYGVDQWNESLVKKPKEKKTNKVTRWIKQIRIKDVLLYFVITIGLVFVIVFIEKKIKIKKDKYFKKNSYSLNDIDEELCQLYKDVNEERIKEILPILSLDYLKKVAFAQFEMIQTKIMEYNVSDLKALCSDYLFSSYKEQLSYLDSKGIQNIMVKFSDRLIKVFDVGVDNGKLYMQVFLTVSFIDYCKNKSTGEIVEGSETEFVTKYFEMTFSRDIQEIKKDLLCQQCDSPILDSTSVVCKRCGAIHNKSKIPFVMEKIVNIHSKYEEVGSSD